MTKVRLSETLAVASLRDYFYSRIPISIFIPLLLTYNTYIHTYSTIVILRNIQYNFNNYKNIILKTPNANISHLNKTPRLRSLTAAHLAMVKCPLIWQLGEWANGWWAESTRDLWIKRCKVETTIRVITLRFARLRNIKTQRDVTKFHLTFRTLTLII